MADATYALSTFLRRKSIVGSGYAYTTEVTSRRSSHTRFAERIRAIRANVVTEKYGYQTEMNELDLSTLD